MFHTINSKFYAIAAILVFLFCMGYGILAFFLRGQHQNTILIQETVDVEREIRTLHDLFYEVRFWERVVFHQEHPKADEKFGAVIELFRKRMSKMHDLKFETFVSEKTELILKSLTKYEEDFNQIIQHKIDQRLNRTRMDTAYQSLVSNVLRSGRTDLFKPLFNLNHFLTTYRIARKISEYQALVMVITYLESKLFKAQLMDHRMRGYVQNYKDLLFKDFDLEQKIQSTNERFDVISTQLMSFMTEMSEEAASFLRDKFLEISESRVELNRIFLISTAMSIAILLLFLVVIARKIVYPIRSIADVMKEVKNKNISSRFDYPGDKDDEIIQLGLSFNEMLDTIQTNNELLQKRSDELTIANNLLTTSLKEKDALLKEIHHRVKNNLQIISSLLRLQARQSDDEQSTAMFKDSQDRILSMALIHEQLYQSKDLSNIDFEAYIKNLVNHLMISFGNRSGKISVDIRAHEIFWEIDMAIPCGLIINEVVSNSLKHAFPSNGEGAIWIAVRLVNNDEIELVIGDDGVGIPEDLDFRKAETFGLQLVTDLVEHQLDGKIEIDCSSGTEFRMRFKQLKDHQRM